MKELTVNQIMVLLDIYRGTNTQNKIGTAREDINTLIKLNLIVSVQVNSGTIKLSGGYTVTDSGVQLVNKIKSIST